MRTARSSLIILLLDGRTPLRQGGRSKPPEHSCSGWVDRRRQRGSGEGRGGSREGDIVLVWVCNAHIGVRRSCGRQYHQHIGVLGAGVADTLMQATAEYCLYIQYSPRTSDHRECKANARDITRIEANGEGERLSALRSATYVGMYGACETTWRHGRCRLSPRLTATVPLAGGSIFHGRSGRSFLLTFPIGEGPIPPGFFGLSGCYSCS